MAERKALSKKLRFEVFKRDKFTCQYCGRMAPDVILEVDHINPVAEGGNNNFNNLVTACQDCNRGKGANSDVVLPSEEFECSIDYCDAQIWMKTNIVTSEETRKFLSEKAREYGIDELITAIVISLDKYYDGTETSYQGMINKIGGILYNRRRLKYGR